MLLQTLYTLFLEHISTLSFIGAFLFGGETIILFASLVSKTFSKIALVYLFGLLGFVCADFFWFYIGKIKSLSVLKKIPYFHTAYKKASKTLRKLSLTNFFFFLLLCKSLYGIAIPVIMCLGRSKKKARHFIINDVICNMFLMALFVFFGWAVGRGYVLLVNVYDSIKMGVLFIVVILIVLYLIKRRLEGIFKRDIEG